MSTLEFKWSVSRGRDTYGYNICSLYVDGRKVASCNGGGYDMKGTCFGIFLEKHFADRLRKLKESDMPEHSHWQPHEKPSRHCTDLECDGAIEHGKFERWEDAPCPLCGKETQADWQSGVTVYDGRYFYGLTFHDPNYEPGKAVIGKDCSDRTLSNASQEGVTVEQAEKSGVSFGLERLQAFYSASSRFATERHTVPSIDGAYGMSSVERIANAIGLTLEYIPTRRKRDSIYKLIDSQS